MCEEAITQEGMDIMTSGLMFHSYARIKWVNQRPIANNLMPLVVPEWESTNFEDALAKTITVMQTMINAYTSNGDDIRNSYHFIPLFMTDGWSWTDPTNEVNIIESTYPT